MTVILNGNQTAQAAGLIDGGAQGPAGITLRTDHAVFKTAWWLGSTSDNNMGTLLRRILV
eukprot:COSAG06_NODE_7710_length_2403_cov_93.648003_4_plen_60_part_00